MDLDDKPKLQRARPSEPAKEAPSALAAEDDLLADMEFDLIDDPDDGDDVFARDTAIPDFPPEEMGLGRPPPKPQTRPKPPPVPRKRLTPVTLEPPSAELEFDNFDAPLDVFSDPPRDGGSQRPLFAPSEIPTAPPQRLPSESPGVTAPGEPGGGTRRRNRAAFLAETTRNRPPVDLSMAEFPKEAKTRAPNIPMPSTNGEGSASVSSGALPSVPPGMEAPPAPSGPPAGAGARELEEAYALGNYTRALEIAEDMLARSPDDRSTRRYAQNCRDVLTQMFAAKIGPLDQVVTVIVSQEEVQWLSLDHRAGFLLSLVDGQSTVDEILDISGMTRLDAMRIIFDLTKQQVVRLA